MSLQTARHEGRSEVGEDYWILNSVFSLYFFSHLHVHSHPHQCILRVVQSTMSEL
jgi:hypothetical protein